MSNVNETFVQSGRTQLLRNVLIWCMYYGWSLRSWSTLRCVMVALLTAITSHCSISSLYLSMFFCMASKVSNVFCLTCDVAWLQSSEIYIVTETLYVVVCLPVKKGLLPLRDRRDFWPALEQLEKVMPEAVNITTSVREMPLKFVAKLKSITNLTLNCSYHKRLFINWLHACAGQQWVEAVHGYV